VGKKRISNRSRQFGAMEYSVPPTDLDAVRLYRLSRIREQLAKHDYAGVLLFDPINVRYATDSTNMQIWCTHYETRCALIMTDGPVVLFEYADLPHLSEGLPTIDEVRVMKVFYYFAVGPEGENRAAEFSGQIDEFVTSHGGGNRRLAIDRLSHLGTDAIRARGIEIFDGLEVTELARSIKSAGEVALMRTSVEVCQIGMAAMQQELRPGITENALWAKLQEANIRLGGEWIETRLLSSGHRTNPWFHECSMRVIEYGEMVSFDTDMIGPYGYCADISRAWVCGNNPTEEQHRLYAHAHDQIQHNIELLTPGMSFREYSERAWAIPPEFVKNSYDCVVHGVGLADEWPSIPPSRDFDEYGYDGTIEPGMALCVESYIGAEGGKEGVKLEEMVLVTDDGIERLSNYKFEEGLL
jgi:Xaa-Pro aminopeptidase